MEKTATKMHDIHKLWSVLLIVGFLNPARADIFFDAATNAVCVSDYPEGYPCTFELLLAADRREQWNKIAYDPAADTYTVSADLRIGSHDGTETYFQAGSSNHPRETVVMRGSIFIEPFFVQGENREAQWWHGAPRINRLTMGEAGNAGIGPVLKFDCRKRGQYGINVGGRKGYGGQFHVYYGVITAVQPDREHAFYSTAAGGDSVVLDHASVSWIDGFMFYGMGNGATQKARLSDSSFVHGGAGLVNGLQFAERCTFSDFDIAVMDYGCLDATLVDCVITNNAANWSLAFSDKGLVCVDCRYDAPRKGNKYLSCEDKKTGKRRYPSFISKRHIIVETVSEDDRPVSNAVVSVTCEQKEPLAALNARQKTDARGRTADQSNKKAALCLIERIEKATDTENQPQVVECAYTIEAAAANHASGRLAGYRPANSWDVVRIRLKRQQ